MIRLKKLSIVMAMLLIWVVPALGVAPADPQATQAARDVLAYLSSLPTGTTNRVISGQFSQDMSDINGVYNATGKYPGVLGVDLQWSRPSYSTIIDYANAGGLIAVSQHWDNPSTGGNAWDTACDLNQVVTEGTQANTRFKSYLDGTAAFLQTLSDAGVVVLFRPLHEMNGAWFWWGGKPAQAYQNLWVYTFDYLNGTKGLHNLLWVYSPSESLNLNYYPGPQYVDIVGVGLYGHGTSVPRVSGYSQIASLDKPFAITEWGMCAGGLTWSPGSCAPRDMTPFISSLKANMPAATYWLAWNGVYSMSYNLGVAKLLNDPWVVTRDEVDISSGSGGGDGIPPQPPEKLDVIAPGATISYPRSGSVIKRSSRAVNVTATLTDDTALKEGTLVVNGVPCSTVECLGKTYMAAFEWRVSSLSRGTYSLRVDATDVAGNLGQSKSINVSVR
jgi:mannan endo-1,4-beta-mannosidase